MIIHNVISGSKEWLDLRENYFTASEAPAMMGCSKFMKRDELLELKKYKEPSPVSDHLQKLFDDGHRTEALARDIISSEIDDELFVMTVSEGRYLASLDGCTMDGLTLFEHKLYNESLADHVKSKCLPAEYYWQLEQQLYVSNAEQVIFVCSDGTTEKREKMIYTRVPGRIETLLSCWEQFESDLKSYEPKMRTPIAVGCEVKTLPSITYKLDGLTLTSNLDLYTASATSLVEESKKELETDQDFADRENLIKEFKKSEKKIKVIKEEVLSEISDVHKFSQAISKIGELIRHARLNSEKQIKSRKSDIRAEIINSARKELEKHISTLLVDCAAKMPTINADLAGSCKGKKTRASIESAVNAELARAKAEANLTSESILENEIFYKKEAKDYYFLFSDAHELLLRERQFLALIIKQRIDDHKIRQEELQKEAEQKDHAPKVSKIEAGPGQPKTVNAEIDQFFSGEVAQSMEKTTQSSGAIHRSQNETIEILTTAIIDVIELAENSEGVLGLHRNGDLATWEELKKSWLLSLSKAEALLNTQEKAANS